MSIADNNNNEKPKNSRPILKATKSEYRIAVITPTHSNNLLKFKNIIFSLYL